jgi:starch phosphorylase
MNTDQSAAPCTALEPLPSSVEAFARDIERYQFYHLGRLLGSPPLYTYQALARTLRDRLMSDWMNT